MNSFFYDYGTLAALVITVIILSLLYASGEFLEEVSVDFGRRTLCHCESSALLGYYTASSDISYFDVCFRASLV